MAAALVLLIDSSSASAPVAIPLKLEARASRDHTLAGPLREGVRKNRRCSRDAFPESSINEYILIYEGLTEGPPNCEQTITAAGAGFKLETGGYFDLEGYNILNPTVAGIAV